MKLKDYFQNWKSQKNLVLVTHYVVISSMLNIAVGSGEIVIVDKNYNVIGTIETMSKIILYREMSSKKALKQAQKQNYARFKNNLSNNFNNKFNKKNFKKNNANSIKQK